MEEHARRDTGQLVGRFGAQVLTAKKLRFGFRPTDNGHEFQAKFHWHVEDEGIRHTYIKPSSPQLNRKMERSHRSDEQEFYQLLTYKGDVDLKAKLAEWERFYNLARPHGAHNGKTPYEALRERGYDHQARCLAKMLRLQGRANDLQSLPQGRLFYARIVSGKHPLEIAHDLAFKTDPGAPQKYVLNDRSRQSILDTEER